MAAPGSGTAAATGVHYLPPVYVDQALAGGEPEVLSGPLHGTLVYTSHEGTTHLYRNGLITSPWGDFSFVTNYCNQVNVWTSTDGGANWFRATPQCHDGDRPWLAGGKANEVFMGTDPVEDSLNHRIFVSTDGGATCGATGIPDFGTTADGGSYTGFGKLFFDHARSHLAEPTVYNDANARVAWPSVVAGDAGKVSVVWYQTEPGELADLDCQPAHIHVMEARLQGGKTTGVVDAAGRVIHYGTVCQGGTGCVATGKDRRLGDFFTNAVDARGRVVIATGDTMPHGTDHGSGVPDVEAALHPPRTRARSSSARGAARSSA